MICLGGKEKGTAYLIEGYPHFNKYIENVKPKDGEVVVIDKKYGKDNGDLNGHYVCAIYDNGKFIDSIDRETEYDVDRFDYIQKQ